MAPIDDQDATERAGQMRPESRHEGGGQHLAILRAALENPDLDQLMGLEGLVHGRDQGITDALLADLDDGREGVGEGAQEAALAAAQIAVR